MMKQRCNSSGCEKAPRRCLAGLVALSLLLTSGMSARAGDASLEYQVKAAFLLNFLKFAEWPADGPQSVRPGQPFVVGVLGSDPFGGILDETFSGKTVEGRPVQVARCRDEDEASRCHIVFLGRDDRRDLKATLEKLQQKNVLTVGESGDFIKSGGVIRFVVADDRVRFEIDMGAAERSRLKLSAKLLQLARKVYKKEESQ